MKLKLSIFMILAISMLFSVSAASCNLNAKLINQDPYPAIPGDYVNAVFQLDGLDNTDCGQVTFRLVEEYPFSLDPTENSSRTVQAGSVNFRDVKSFLLIPYRLRIDEKALDGESRIRVAYSSNSGGIGASSIVQEFNITVKDLGTDFEIFVKDYNAVTKTITFDILNIGKNNVDAVVAEVLNQENLVVKGSSKSIIGSLDSNEDTTFSYEAIPKEGDISLTIAYSDSVHQRRFVSKVVQFDPLNFEDRVRDQKETPYIIYSIIVIVVVVIAWFVYRRFRKKSK